MLFDDIYVMWIPILVIALMAALGWWRGVYRELIVSASIVLSALVAVQWATRERWALDLSNTFSGLGPGEWQFFLTLVLLALIVAVAGYGLGGLFSQRSLSSTSRTLGGLLGLANGAALSGWVLRAAYEGLVNRQDTSTVYQNPVSLSLMVWAGWFPVALAVVAAIAALVFSLTGERADAVTNASSTNVNAHELPRRDLYLPPVQPIYPQGAISPSQARADFYTPRSTSAPSPVFPPTREQTSTAPTLANPIAPLPSFTIAPVQPPEARAALPVRPSAAGIGSNAPDVAPPQKPPAAPAATAPVLSSDVPHTPPFGYDVAAIWGRDDRDAPPMSAPSNVPAKANGSPVTVEGIAPSPVEKQCPNCGNTMQPGAVFCTECGRRLEEGA